MLVFLFFLLLADSYFALCSIISSPHEYTRTVSWEIFRAGVEGINQRAQRTRMHARTRRNRHRCTQINVQTNKRHSFALSDCGSNAPIHPEQRLIGSEPRRGVETAFLSVLFVPSRTRGIGLPATADLEGTDPGHKQMSHCSGFLLGAAIK